MSTRWSIGEQIKLRLAGGKGKEADWADIREIYTAIGQVLNQLVKLDYFKGSMPIGETIPDGICVATYDNIPIIPYKNIAKLTLPAMPIRLPRNMGVFAISPYNLDNASNILTAPFIPIPMGHSVLVNGQPLIDDLLGHIGYECHGLEVLFRTDITQAPYSITAATVKLLVMDMSNYSDYDLLPIPADMEAACIEQVYQIFSGEPAPDKVDDPIAITVKPQRNAVQ